MRHSVIVTVGLTLLALTGVSATDQWPQFRGSQAGVADDDSALPDTWSETENVVWKVSIPGQSWSSPVVWDDHIFVTSAISSGAEPAPVRGLSDPTAENGRMKSSAVHRWMVYDVDFRTGKIRWERELHGEPPSILRHIRNSYASETPVTDGDRVYVYFGSIGLVAALDMNGRTVWTKEIGAFESQQGWGMAASPILYKDRLYIVNDNKSQSFIAAFDKNTGNEVWKVTRDEVESWSTPVAWENELRTEIVTAGMRRVRSSRPRRQAAVGTDGDVGFRTNSHPVRQTRVRLHQFGLPGQCAASGVRNSPRRIRRHLAQGRRDEQSVRRLVRAVAGKLPNVSAGLRRLLLHAARPRLLAVSRRSDRQAGLRPPTPRGRVRLRGVAVGVQREDFRGERGR